MAKKKQIITEEPLGKKLWKAADKLCKNMDAAEYKHIVLGLIFLKYISDAFKELHQKLLKGEGEYEAVDPEDKNEYLAEVVTLLNQKQNAGNYSVEFDGTNYPSGIYFYQLIAVRALKVCHVGTIGSHSAPGRT